VKALLKRPVLIDLRNIYRPDDMAARGFVYRGIGRAGMADGEHAAARMPAARAGNAAR
jgi:UDPglucose 6-dehydrogenase